MRFKDFFAEHSVGTMVANGGVQQDPEEELNTGYPVLSKYVASGKPEKSQGHPEKKFGFKRRIVRSCQ